MAEAALIHPDKVHAYLATGYHLGHGPQNIVLTIGTESPPLAALFAVRGVDCGGFITAYNPRGARQSDAANDRAHALLVARLAGLGLQSIEGAGSEDGSDWPAERSCFALGLPLETARSIGAEFDQDAIVWVGADAVPRLILLR